MRILIYIIDLQFKKKKKKIIYSFKKLYKKLAKVYSHNSTS